MANLRFQNVSPQTTGFLYHKTLSQACLGHQVSKGNQHKPNWYKTLWKQQAETDNYTINIIHVPNWDYYKHRFYVLIPHPVIFDI